MAGPERRVLMGRIVGVSGVHGEVKVISWSDPRERIFSYQPWWLERDGSEPERIEGVRGHRQGQGWVALIPGVTDRDQAATLIGADIAVARDQLPAPPSGEYYWADLESLTVVTTEGVELGRVSRVMATGANDVLVVREGGHERLIPFVMGRYVQEVDLDSGRVVVDWDPDF